MTRHTTNSIRNVVLASHAGAGKTSLAEALAFSAGVIPTMGSTSTGNTVGDFEPEEVHHHHSMSTALLHFNFKETAFNILDAPGALDFFADMKSTIHVADAAVLVMGASGLRSEVERVWDVIQEREIPSMIFVNELDKEHTNFESTLDEISKVLEITCIPIAIPLGQEAGFEGVIDLLNQKAVSPVPNSHKIQETDVPAELQGKVDDARKKLIESAAEGSDELLEKYLGEGELSKEEILQGLALATRNRSCVPVLCGAATKNIGTTVLLEAITQLLPCPQERTKASPLTGRHPQTGEDVAVTMTDGDPFSAYVFKTTIDPFMGRLTYIKVQSGSLNADSHFYNSVRNVKEKGGHLYRMLGKKTTQVGKVSAGDIVSIAKLKDTLTGDTICTDKHPVILPAVTRNRPVMSFALEPKAKGDIDKVSLGLHKLVEEDPSLEFLRNEETKEMLLSGVGQTHIEITLEKLHRKYGVDVDLHTPKVAYRETIQKMAQAQGKYKK